MSDQFSNRNRPDVDSDFDTNSDMNTRFGNEGDFSDFYERGMTGDFNQPGWRAFQTDEPGRRGMGSNAPFPGFSRGVFGPGTESRPDVFGPNFGAGTPGRFSGFGNFSNSYRYGGGNWQQHGPHTGKGPKNYTRTDERINEDVCMRLEQNGQLDASDIEVNVKNGIVTLSGTVDNRPMKRLAADIADSVAGVQDVMNNIQVNQSRQWGGNQSQHQRQGQQQTSSASAGTSQSSKSR